MWKEESRLLFKDWSAKVVLGLFIGLIGWWIGLQYTFTADEGEHAKMIWGACYQIISLFGGVLGLKIAFDWGGEKSVVGRMLIAFSAGLLLQTFGQSIFSYYNLFTNTELPYPSLADIGFFGSIVFYIYGAVLLAHASGAHVSAQVLKHQTVFFLIPIVMLALPYLLFLNGYDFHEANPIQVILDFGYPIGQSIYVSVTVLTYLLTRKSLGGVMKHRVLFILLALVVQYLADFNFLYQAVNENWAVSGYGDVIYLIAYFLLALGLIQMKTTFVLSSDNRT